MDHLEHVVTRARGGVAGVVIAVGGVLQRSFVPADGLEVGVLVDADLRAQKGVVMSVETTCMHALFQQRSGSWHAVDADFCPP